MALPASESFTGANGTTINSLASWAGAKAGASGSQLGIQSNQAQAGAVAETEGCWWTADSFDDNHYAEATITAVTSGVYIGVAARVSGTAATKTAAFDSDGRDGIIKYTIQDGDIDAAGDWKVFARVAGGGAEITTNFILFHVQEHEDA